MKRSIRVLALVPYPLGKTPSQRYRIEQWQPYLEREGISVSLSPFATEGLMRVLYSRGHLAAKASGLAVAFTRRFIQLAQLGNYDVVLIHRAACLAGPAVLERAIALLGKPVIFDFDDAIYLLHTTSVNESFGWLKFPGKTASICRSSAHIVVGNSYLADYARLYNPRVTIIPSSVEIEHYRPRAKQASDGPAVIGWMGSSTSQTHLEAFAPVLRDLCAHRRVVLRVVSDREPDLPGVSVEWRRWSAETEIAELAGFDIGIMPMPDDPWARGKCSMKALLYMSMGIPTICSAVGTNREVIEHGRNGLLAATAKDWVESLDRLLKNPLERERLGLAGRETVERRFSVEYCAANFAQVIQQAAENQRPAAIYGLSDPKEAADGSSTSRN